MMPTIELVARAKDLAHRAHAGQVDKAGRPYIEHVARVAAAVSDYPEAEAVAWLHDFLEDCNCAAFGDEFMEFPEATRDAVADLTRFPAHSDGFYYWRVRYSPIALRVKLADIADNSDEDRLALLEPETADRLRRKYANARKALGVT